MGAVVVAAYMLLELILLAWVEAVNLGSLKCHIKFSAVNRVSFPFALYTVHCISGSICQRRRGKKFIKRHCLILSYIFLFHHFVGRDRGQIPIKLNCYFSKSSLQNASLSCSYILRGREEWALVHLFCFEQDAGPDDLLRFLAT